MRKCISCFIAILAFGLMGSDATAAITVDFDTAANWTAGSGGITSYQIDHVYADQGLVFTGGPALRNGTATQDGFAGALGTFAWRLRDAAGVFTGTYADTSVGGTDIDGFGFSVRRWDASPDTNVTIEYSFDGGGSYTLADTINNTLLGSSSDWFSYSTSFSDTTVADGEFMVRLTTTAPSERIMFDNFSLSTITAVPEPSSFAVLGLIGGAIAYRRRNRTQA